MYLQERWNAFRSEAQRLVEGLGGSASPGVSSQTDYVVVGSEAGARSLAQAKSKGVKTLSEKEFIKLLREAGADL